MLHKISRAEAYQKLRAINVNPAAGATKLETKIASKFTHVTPGQLVDQLQTRRTIDDQRVEMHRRCKLAGIHFSFDAGDKVQFKVEVEDPVYN